jgi:hypothetical protein
MTRGSLPRPIDGCSRHLISIVRGISSSVTLPSMPCYCYRCLQQSTCFGSTLLQSTCCHKLFRDVDAFWFRSPIVLRYCRLAWILFNSSPVLACHAATILNCITLSMRQHTTLAIHSVAYCGSPSSRFTRYSGCVDCSVLSTHHLLRPPIQSMRFAINP